MSLYHTYRPQSLEQVKGNAELKSSLAEALSVPDKMPHSYLFHGGTGCGKTTIGRIIKNVLEVTDNDYSEVNSSQMRGIDTIREIINKCQYKPLESKYRIFLIDECHKLTNDAQNAFLKILEDTPKHIIFILCTTEPNKLIKAIKGRCSQYEVKPLDDREMMRLLKQVVRKENATIESEVLNAIIKSAEGHSRNALQILEQVLNTSPDKRLEVAKQAEILENESIELCRALLKRQSWKQISSILTGLKGQEPESIRRVVLGYCQSVLLNGKTDNQAALIMECFIDPFYDSGFPGLTFACYQSIQ